MSQSAHDELDGELDREDIEQAYTRGFESDERLWGELILDEVKDTIDRMVELVADEVSDAIAAKLAMHVAALKRRIQRPELDPKKVLQRLIDRMAKAGILSKPRGRGKIYKLSHTDGKPYLTEDGGHQISKAGAADRRERERLKKQSQRASAKLSEEIRSAHGGVLSFVQAAETPPEVGLSPGDSRGDSLGDVAADTGASSNADRSTEQTSAPSSLFDGNDQTRPPAGHVETEEEKIRAALEQQPQLRPIAKRAMPRLSELMKDRGLSLPTIEGMIKKAAEQCRWWWHEDVRDPAAWTMRVLYNVCAETSVGDLSELAHERRKKTAADEFPPRRVRSAAEREREEEHERVAAQAKARRAAAFRSQAERALESMPKALKAVIDSAQRSSTPV